MVFSLGWLSMIKKITAMPEWQALESHQKQIAGLAMRDWFAEDPLRFTHFSLAAGDLFLDYSKNRITQETMHLLGNLATAIKLSDKIEALFNGSLVNKTENRPALHTALRNRSNSPVLAYGSNVMPLITANLDKMRKLTDSVRHGHWKSVTGKPMRDIVNIGIGGSDLGPLMTTQALSDYANSELRCHFISNIDAASLSAVLDQINPETTLFIISSKTFTTIETMTNANTIKQWLQEKMGKHSIDKHFLACTAAFEKAIQFGIPEANIFPLWDWVGGRYSVWSAIGLPLALSIGMDHFLEFLEGGFAMDQHFRQAEFSANMPVILGLLGVWYHNFFGAETQAIIPYSHHLSHLHTYLQQADMESNGKSTSLQGDAIDYTTGPIIWGGQGCNGQHAFYQLLHQSHHLVPIDFILTGENKHHFDHHQDILVASGLSQAQALMQGKSYQEASAALLKAGCDPEKIPYLAQHQTIPGNRPSNVLFLPKISPYHLGALLALYEHKIFVQGMIWDINSFDQWGVELGKQLLPSILANLNDTQPKQAADSSTQGLIQHYKKLRNTH